MKKAFKKYFIPHKGNKFHPHILHTKRAIFYSLVFLLTKIIILIFVAMLPLDVFVLPDVLAEEQRQLINLTNQIRQAKNLPALTISDKLDLSAQHKADDMATNNYFAHTSNNKSLATWLKAAGYNYAVAGENLAVGFSGAADVVAAWQNSQSHYANLIDPEFKDIGVGLSGGVYNGRATVFIAEHFGAPLALTPTQKITSRKSFMAQIDLPQSVQTEETASQNNNSVLAAAIRNTDQNEMPVINTDQPTPIEKYIQAKKFLSPLTNIFAVSQNIYLLAIFFFSSVLLLNIILAKRKQRLHVIAQTSGLIALLIIFWRF